MTKAVIISEKITKAQLSDVLTGLLKEHESRVFINSSSITTRDIRDVVNTFYDKSMIYFIDNTRMPEIHMNTIKH